MKAEKVKGFEPIELTIETLEDFKFLYDVANMNANNLEKGLRLQYGEEYILDRETSGQLFNILKEYKK